MSRQECRQAFVLVRVDQPISSTFAHVHQIGNRDRYVIEHEGKWCAMKVTAGNHLTAVCKYKWVIGGRCGFNQQNIFAMCQRAADCSVHLRHATQAVCVLDAWITLEMRLANFTALHKRQKMFGYGFLARVRTRVV